MAVNRVLILGAGQITAGYDKPGDAHVLTHLHAITRRPAEFTARVYDPAFAKAEAAARKWGVTALASLDGVSPGDFDLVVIASPDAHHVAGLEAALAWKPKAVLCEKPLALRSEDAARVVQAYAQAGIPLSVNLQRRFEPEAAGVRERFRRGELGALLFGECRYSKGILHNGIHAVDFCRWFFGEPRAFTAFGRRVDYLDQDPSVSAWVAFERGDVAFLAGDERQFSLFEFDFVFEKARFAFENGGTQLRAFQVKDDPLFPGYREQYAEAPRATQLPLALGRVYDELAAVLGGRAATLTSPGADSVASLKLINALTAAAPATPTRLA